MLEFLDGAEKSIKLSGKISIYKCSELRKQLMLALEQAKDKGGTWKLDLSHIEGFDVASLQILIAFQKELQSHNAKLIISQRANAFDTLLKDLNLENSFAFEK